MRIDLEQLDFDERHWILNGSPYSGDAYINYPDGILEREFSIDHGIKHGPCRMFYPDGQLRKQFNLRQGAAHGEGREWYSNGQLRSAGSYEFGVELQYDEWDAIGKLIESRRIDKESELMKYVETMRERAKA